MRPINACDYFDEHELTEPICCIVQLQTQPPGVLHRVMLRPDKIADNRFIRLGDTPGDEAVGWMYWQNIEIHFLLGKGIEQEDKSWKVVQDVKRAA